MAGALGRRADEIYDITVAVQEASANAVEHAYAPGTAVFEVEARPATAWSTFVIRDRGHWRAPRGTHRGRGTGDDAALMETVDVTTTSDGTGGRVLRRTLGRRAA